MYSKLPQKLKQICIFCNFKKCLVAVQPLWEQKDDQWRGNEAFGILSHNNLLLINNLQQIHRRNANCYLVGSHYLIGRHRGWWSSGAATWKWIQSLIYSLVSRDKHLPWNLLGFPIANFWEYLIDIFKVKKNKRAKYNRQDEMFKLF